MNPLLIWARSLCISPFTSCIFIYFKWTCTGWSENGAWLVKETLNQDWFNKTVLSSTFVTVTPTYAGTFVTVIPTKFMLMWLKRIGSIKNVVTLERMYFDPVRNIEQCMDILLWAILLLLILMNAIFALVINIWTCRLHSIFLFIWSFS